MSERYPEVKLAVARRITAHRIKLRLNIDGKDTELMVDNRVAASIAGALTHALADSHEAEVTRDGQGYITDRVVHKG